jgi:hypothetical protein
MVGFSTKIMTSASKKCSDVVGAVSYATKIMWKHPLDLMFLDKIKVDSHQKS